MKISRIQVFVILFGINGFVLSFFKVVPLEIKQNKLVSKFRKPNRCRKKFRVFSVPDRVKKEVGEYLEHTKGNPQGWQVLRKAPSSPPSSQSNGTLAKSEGVSKAAEGGAPAGNGEDHLVTLEELKGYVKAIQYLQKDVRLGADQLERVYIGSMVATDFSKEKLKDRVVGIRKALGVKKDQLSEVLNQNPTLLSKDLDALVSTKCVEFAKISGFTKAQARKVVLGIPELLSGEIDEDLVKKKIKGFELHLNWTVAEVGKVASVFPQVLLANFDRGLKPFDNYFRGQLGMSSVQVAKIAETCPSLITFKLERLRQTEAFLRNRIEASDAILQKIIIDNPFVFSYELDKMVEQVVSFFEIKLEMEPSQIGKMLSVNPHLLSLGVEDKLLPRVNFLLNEVGLKRKSLVKVLLAHPQTLAYRTEENIKPKLLYFQEYLGMTSDQTRKMISEYPQLLSLSTENNIKRKVNLFQEKLGVSKDFLSNVISSNPSMLSCSIDRRILPRIQQMEDCGIRPSGKCILQITKYPDMKFHNWLQDKL